MRISNVTGRLEIGWMKNSNRHGNYYVYQPDGSPDTDQTGWFENDVRIGSLRTDVNEYLGPDARDYLI